MLLPMQLKMIPCVRSNGTPDGRQLLVGYGRRAYRRHDTRPSVVGSHRHVSAVLEAAYFSYSTYLVLKLPARNLDFDCKMLGRALPESRFAMTIVSALLTVGGRRRWPADGAAARHTERPGHDSDTVDRRHPSRGDSGGSDSRRRRPTAPTDARQVTSVGPDVLGLPTRRAAARPTSESSSPTPSTNRPASAGFPRSSRSGKGAPTTSFAPAGDGDTGEAGELGSRQGGRVCQGVRRCVEAGASPQSGSRRHTQASVSGNATLPRV